MLPSPKIIHSEQKVIKASLSSPIVPPHKPNVKSRIYLTMKQLYGNYIILKFMTRFTSQKKDFFFIPFTLVFTYYNFRTLYSSFKIYVGCISSVIYFMYNLYSSMFYIKALI